MRRCSRHLRPTVGWRRTAVGRTTGDRKDDSDAGTASGGIALFPGAAERIRELAGLVPMAIASGALRHEILMVLERAGLTPCFTAIVAAGETTRGKPAPEPYARAVEMLARQRLGNRPREGRRGGGHDTGSRVGAGRAPSHDRVDKRKFLFVTQVLEMAESVVLGILAFMDHPPLAALLVTAACAGVIAGLRQPGAALLRLRDGLGRRPAQRGGALQHQRQRRASSGPRSPACWW